MNISLIAEATGAGVGTHVIQLATGLLALNHRVDLAYSPLRMDTSFHSGVGRLRRERGFTSCELGIHRNPHPTDFGVMRTLRQRVRRHGPFDIVHCHSTKAGLVGRLGMLAVGTRVVYTPHAMLTLNPGLGRLARWLVGRMEYALSHIGHALIAVSDEEKAHAMRLGIPESRLFVVPNGIQLQVDHHADDARARIRSEVGIDDSVLCLGFVGRLFPQKAPDTLLRAFAQLDPETARGTHLLMVGSGPLHTGLKELAATLAIENRVTWLGERDGRTIMPAFDMFVLPSDYEGLPYVVLEAMSQGLPIISTNVGGIGMLVEDGLNGRVVPVRRPDLLASALQAVCRSLPTRHRMGLESARRVKEFSLEKMVANTLGVYHAVLESQAIAAPANHI